MVDAENTTTTGPTLEQTLLQLIQGMQLTQQQNGQMNLELATRMEEMLRNTNGSTPTNRPREKLPTLSPFDGTRSQFEGWLITAQNKLETDSDYLGDKKAQLRYIYASLKSEAQGMCIAWYRTNEDTASASDLLAYLASIYSDPNRARRAMNKLATMEQRDNEHFSKFLPRFETQLANAGASATEDAVKISWLERALNKTMRHHLQYIYPIPTTYREYTSLLQTIASRYDALQVKTKAFPFTKRNPDAMDWEPTTRTQQTRPMGTQRATWVTKDVINHRRANGLCLRCGNKSHMIAKCPLQPAIRANVSMVKAQAQTEGEESSADLLGKE